MKLTYRRDEFGDYDVYSGEVLVGSIYRSALARFWIVEAGGKQDAGYATLTDAKAGLLRILNH